MLQTARGLEYLHSNHCVHGNLNICTVLLCKDGTVKIADVGYDRKTGIMDDKSKSWWRSPESLQEGVCTTMVSK